MPEIDDNGPDDQDFSEVFDEDNFDEADAGAPTNEFIDGVTYDGRKPNEYINQFKIGLKADSVL